MKVLGGGDDDGKSPSSFTFSTGVVVVATTVPLIFGGACAFAFTCKPPCLDLIPPSPRLADPPPSLEGFGEVIGKIEDVAAVATILNF